jgi:YVTN family beta-propeller protein
MRPLLRLVLCFWLPVLAEGAALAAPFAYVVNNGSGTVSVVDTATNAVTATIPVGAGPRAVAVNRAGTRAYVSHAYGGSLFVSVIDTLTNAIVAAVPVPKAGPEVAPQPSGGGIAANPSDTRIYAASDGHELAVIDTATNTLIASAYAGEGAFPGGVAVNPAGTRVYVADWLFGNLHVVDASTYAHIARIPLTFSIEGVAVNPAGTRVYVADSSSYVWVIDAMTNSVVTRILVEGGPYGVAVNPDGRWLYVSVVDRDAVALIDTANDAIVGSVAVGTAPTGIAIDPAGKRLHVANFGSDDVSVIDVFAGTLIATVKVGTSPSAVAIGPEVVATDSTYTVVEFYNVSLDHYFITWMPDEIATLDAAIQIRGWSRTGYGFKTHVDPQAGTSSVCRFYIPPGLGDSHFFGRGTVECTETAQKYPSFVVEDPSFMQMFLPAAGICPIKTTQVYRIFSNRADANHRYTIDRAVRNQMVNLGWLAEGDGPDLVVMCAPQ